MKKGFKLLSIFIILAMLFALTPCSAANSKNELHLSCSNENVVVGKEFSVDLSANFGSPCNISAFRIMLKFDKTKLNFKSVSSKDSINKNEIKYSLNGDVVTAIYLTSNEGINLISNIDTPLCSFKFIPKDSPDFSSSTISASVDGLVDYNINEITTDRISPLTINIFRKLPFDCSLKILVPSDGSLSPKFKPNIYKYDLDVPYSTKFIDFDAIPNNENASVKINRKNLNSPGSTTPINITVTDNETKDKLIYTVNVNRAGKPINNNETKPPNDSGNNKNPNKNNSSNNYSNSSSNSNLSNSSGVISSNDYVSGSDSYSNNDDSLSDNSQNQVVDAIAPLDPDSEIDNNLNSVSKTIVVKENKFNVFFAGVCGSSLIFIIGYIIYKKIKNLEESKNNVV